MSLNGRSYFLRGMSLKAVIPGSSEDDREITQPTLQTVEEIREFLLEFRRHPPVTSDHEAPVGGLAPAVAVAVG